MYPSELHNSGYCLDTKRVFSQPPTCRLFTNAGAINVLIVNKL